jgi:hypothetical protein
MIYLRRYHRGWACDAVGPGGLDARFEILHKKCLGSCSRLKSEDGCKKEKEGERKNDLYRLTEYINDVEMLSALLWNECGQSLI